MKKNIKKIIAVFILIASLIAGYFIFLQKPETAVADWFDDSWLYRQIIAVANSGSAQTDFQVQLTVDTATLYTAGKIQSDCDDIRITDLNGKLLDHWIEPTTCNTATTKVWTKIPSIPATTGASIYLYYGNSAAISTSSTANTFIREIAGVQGAWDMDEASANTCSGGVNDSCDSSGNSNDGAWNGDATSVTGKFGNGTVYDGTEDYMNGGSDNSLNVFGGDSTLELWAKWIDTRVQQNPIGLITIGTFTDKIQLGLGYNSPGRLSLRVGSGSYGTWVPTIGPSSMNDGNWHHIVVIKSNSTITLYVNTSSYSYGPYGGITINNYNRVGYAYGGAFDGSIDNVRIYNTALSAAEISDLYGAGGDRQGYVTTNYPNKSLVRKYSASVSAGSPSSEERGPGPVAYWKFDEGYGDTAYDSTINANNGTRGGGTADYKPTWQSEDMCVSGKCLRFDGVDDYVNMGNDDSLDFSSAFSIDMWVKPTVVTEWGRFLEKGGYESGDGGYSITWSSSTQRIRAALWSGAAQTYIDSNNSLVLGQWSHMAINYNGTTISIFINGNFDKDGAGTLTSTAYDLIIGKRSVADLNYFNGFIDDVRVYPYARTAAQVKADYAARGTAKGVSASLGKAPEEGSWMTNGLVGYWKMDEASWNGTAGEVLDASGAGNNGTAVGATGIPTTGAGKFGNGGVFDGVDDYVNAGNGASLNITGAITVEAWVKFNNVVSTKYILGQAGSAAGQYALRIGATDNKIDVIWGGLVIDTSIFSFQTGSWYLIGFTRSGSSGAWITKIYVNGVLDKTTATSINPGSGTVFDIGRPGGTTGFNFNGSIDEVRIYNRALSAKEVSDLYNYAPGPVGWWKMDDASKGAAQTKADSSGYGNNGTTYSANGTGMDCTLPGKYGKGCQFDGVDDYVDAGAESSLNITGAITVEAWVYTTRLGGANQEIVNKYSASDTTRSWRFEMTGQYSRPSFSIYHDGTSSNVTYAIAPTGTYYNNSWYHITGVFDTTHANLYVNGNLITSTAASSSVIFQGVANVDIGHYFAGFIDDVRIYNYARTSKQIVSDMNAGHPAGGSPIASQVGYWKFDEGYGTTANNSGFGGTALNGAMTNFASPAIASSSGWTDAGKFGKALQFDGGDDVATVTNSTAIDLNDNLASGSSISVWVNPDTAGEGSGGQIFQKGTNTYLRVDTLSGGRLDVEGKWDLTTTDANLNISSAIPVNTWSHIVMSYDGAGKITLWINGINKGSHTGAGIPAADANNLLIGGTTTDNFDGVIDEFKLYNYELTADEIKLEYNHGASVVMGAVSTSSDGVTASNSASRAYCIPGDTSTCNPPVAYWNFDEKTGTSANDISGNANTGTLGGGTESYRPTWISGKVGPALKFDGVDDYVEIGKTMITSTSTICAWIKLNTSSQDRSIVGQFSNAFWTAYGVGLKYTNGNVIVMSEVNNDNAALSTALTDISSWHFICGVVGTVNGKLYLDGIEKANGNLSSTYGYWFEIGAARVNSFASPTNFFSGSIDDVRIYNYARTPAQVAWDYNRGKPVAHWEFDECQGAIAYDASGNSYNATIYPVTLGNTTVGTCGSGTSTEMWNDGTAGKFNASLGFDGSDDYVSIPTISLSSGGATLATWVNLGSFTDAFVVGKTDSSSPYVRIVDSTTIRVQTDTSDYKDFTVPTLYTGQWYFIIVTRNGGVTKVYLNGIESSSGGQSQTYATMTLNAIGRYFTNQEMNGLIDDVRIYNYALTAEQIKTEYNGGAVRFE